MIWADQKNLHFNMEEDKDQDPSSEHLLSRKLMCIEYPAIVKDENKMLKTLGGIKNISTVYSEKNRRLELRFRPDDVYCRPTCGDKQKTGAFLIKVKILRKKKIQSDGASTSSKTIEQVDDEFEGRIIGKPTVIGRVETVFRFSSLCDFQYLPMRQTGNKMEYIYDTLVPKGLLTPDWFTKSAEYFLPPAAFSRMDTMQNYQYRQEPVDIKSNVAPYIIGRTRRRRSGHATFVSFNVENIPSKPRDLALKYLQIKFLAGEHFEKIKELFKKRPVWSKVALLTVTKFNLEQMKYLLPAVAYYFVTGPFRIMWVRYGYDPRKDPASRIYQSIDYRIRLTGGLQNLVKAKRSYTNYLLPYKSGPSSRPKTVVITSAPEARESSESETPLPDTSYIFRPGTIPPSRQMFYQLCDIKEPEIEGMIARLPRIPQGSTCHERLGWLPPGFAEQCRDIINNIVIEQLKKEQNDHPQPSTSTADPDTIEEEEIEDYWSSDPRLVDDYMEWEDT